MNLNDVITITCCESPYQITVGDMLMAKLETINRLSKCIINYDEFIKNQQKCYIDQNKPLPTKEDIANKINEIVEELIKILNNE